MQEKKILNSNKIFIRMNVDDREMISGCCECRLRGPGSPMARDPAVQLQPIYNLWPHSEASDVKPARWRSGSNMLDEDFSVFIFRFISCNNFQQLHVLLLKGKSVALGIIKH